MMRWMALGLAGLVLAGCGGMTRAVEVVPNTLDDLGRRTAPLRGDENPPPRP